MKIRLISYFLIICTIATIATKDLYFYKNMNSRNLQVSHTTNGENNFLPGYLPDSETDSNVPMSNSDADVSGSKLDGNMVVAVSELNSETDTSKLLAYKKPTKVKKNDNDNFKTKSLSVIENNPQYFLKNMFEVLTKDLKNADIVKEINSNHNFYRKDTPWYIINPKSPFKYIKIPISLVPLLAINRNNDIIYLIFDTNNFHLQGYQKLKLNIPTYYHFANATITSIKQNQKFLKSIKLEIKTNYEKLSYDNNVLTWKEIYASFNKLFDGSMTLSRESISETDIQNIMIITLEALKFRNFQKLLNYNADSTMLTSNILNQWKNFFLDKINMWGKSSEIKRMIKNLEERGDINSLVLRDYVELILPPDISKFLYKNSATDNYELKISEKTLYYDPITMENKITIFTSINGNAKQSFEIYDMNLKKINPIRFNKFNFIGDTGSSINSEWSTQTKWGSTIYNDRNHNIDNFPASSKNKWDGQIHHKSNELLETKYYESRNWTGFIHKKITAESSWREIMYATPFMIKEVSDKQENFITFINSLNTQTTVKKFAEISAQQYCGLTWYYDNEKDEYHLQLIIYYNVSTLNSSANVTSKLKIGSGIRIYEYS